MGYWIITLNLTFNIVIPTEYPIRSGLNSFKMFGIVKKLLQSLFPPEIMVINSVIQVSVFSNQLHKILEESL